MKNSDIYIFVVLYYCWCCVSISSVEISPCAKWKSDGVTVAGNGIAGDQSTQLAIPSGIFLLKKTNTLFIADSGNDRVQVISSDKPSTSATTIISNVHTPSKIYVDDDDDENKPTIYISVFIGNRVEKWTYGASEGIQLGGECRSCYGISVDENRNVYMSEADRHRVMKWSPQTNLMTLVAGQTDERGTTAEYLSDPDGIYFDRSNDELYIADSGNNRIQKWSKDALSGVEVAGSNTSTPDAGIGSLANPNGVWVDEHTKIVYIADKTNNRIVRWLPNAIVGDIIAGGQGTGNATNQFNTPKDLTFDSQGNLYVCDTWNHRVQFFAIVDNQPCGPTSTGHSHVFCLCCTRYNSWITAIVVTLTCIIRELF